jgi:hypothetical protein
MAASEVLSRRGELVFIAESTVPDEVGIDVGDGRTSAKRAGRIFEFSLLQIALFHGREALPV